MTALLALAAGVGIFAGSVLHEAVHAATARVLGADTVEVDWLGLDVYYRLDGPQWRHTAVALAPAVVGIGGGALALAAGVLAWGALGLAVALTLLVSGVRGGMQDWRGATGRAQ